MLPDLGTAERKLIDDEALRVGLAALHDENGNIPSALYRVYMHYRERYIEARGLLDAVPGVGEEREDALVDARRLERHVCDQWAATILRMHPKARQ